MKFTEIGVIVKPHGLKGAVVVKAEVAYNAQFRGFELLYLNQFESMVPYAIEDLAVLSTTTFKLTLRGVNSVEKAEALRGTPIFQQNDLLSFSDEVDWVGMTVVSKDGNDIGKVVDTVENKAQLLLVVQSKTVEEQYIPLVEAFIVEMDLKEGTITLDLPEGLLDL